ncbi:MAG: amidohydrolase [Methylobacteriaceae bacterium]|nr:amidohydrolase [Methylobacteriaceae bacterium]
MMRFVCALVIALFPLTLAHAQEHADKVLLNGKILTLDKDFSVKEALAIRDGRIVATGTNADMQRHAGDKTQRIDLAGRTVIPGLTDMHLHGIRAALTYSLEVSWIGVPSLAEALARIKAAAQKAAPGQWIIVAGGWTDIQFKEKRKPTQAEIVVASPDNPVYIQHLYEWVLMSPRAFAEMQISGDADLPKFGKLVRDDSGKPTGEIEGNGVTFTALFNKLPRPNFAQEVEGTKAFFRELSRLGITGFIDPAGVSVGPASYQPLYSIWQDKEQTVRVAYTISSQKPGAELEDYKALTQLMPSGFGDDMLRFAGIGEIVTWAAWTDGDPSDEAMTKLEEIIRWAAQKRMGFQIHWNPERTVDKLLTILERVNAETPIGDLRWWIDHLYDASDRSLARMKALGIAWGVQDSLYFNAATFKKMFGVAVAERSPPVKNALAMGLMVGAGTDAHRVSNYNPFVSLRWFINGKTIDGAEAIGETQHPSRAEALRMYTLNSAWFAHDDDKRGSLEAGKYADLAVLNKDYMNVPDEEIGSIESVLTLLGGRVVYSADPYAQLEGK